MKVLHLIGGGDVGGAKTHVLSLVKELGKHADVKIVALRPGKFAEDAIAMGIDTEVVKSGNIVNDIRHVVRIIRDGGYRIIHSHGAKANMFAVAAGRITRLPVVTTVHSDYRLDYMHSKFKTMTFGKINSISLRLIDYHIAISENFRAMLIDRGFMQDGIYTLYNGMDFDEYPLEYTRKSFSEKFGIQIDDEDILVGIAARLYPVKGIDILINAAKEVLNTNPHVKFLIGGDGEDRLKLEKQASELGISDKVFFLGWLDDPYELMGIVDISVLTSLSESFAYSVLEGAKFKKATISSRVGGIPDLIDSGDNGYLFEPGDHKKLAEYILELSQDSAKRQTMGEKIYLKASTYFSLKNMCSTQLRIYETILKDSSLAKHERSSYDIIISGYYGFRNIGDDAMLMAIIESLRKFKPDIKIAVLSRKPAETMKSYRVNAFNRLDLSNVLRTMKKAKLFIYGGGNLIQDNTSTRSLFFYLGMTWLAKKLGLKVMFYGNGIGPLKKQANRRLTSRIIDQVDVITLREELSLNELKSLCISKPRIILTADPAMTVSVLDMNKSDNALMRQGINPETPLVGFSVRKYPGHEDFKHEAYEDMIASTADYMAEKYGVVPLFIPMQGSDADIAKNIINKMRHKAHIIQSVTDISDTISIIGRLELMIGMRLHALIFAANQGVPVIGLVYDEPKIEGFLKCIGQAPAGHVNRIEFKQMKEIADQVWANRESIKEKLKRDISKLKEKSLENARIAVELIKNKYTGDLCNGKKYHRYHGDTRR